MNQNHHAGRQRFAEGSRFLPRRDGVADQRDHRYGIRRWRRHLFDMNDDLIMALYPKAALANDAKLSVRPPSPANFSFGHIVRSKQEVDAVMTQAEKAGAKITDPARDRF